MSIADTALPLATVIEDLRRELVIAMRKGEGEAVRFRLRPIEIELQVAVERGVEANAGAKFWVLDFGGKASAGDTVTHTIKLSLEPVGTGGGELLVSGLGTRQ